MATSPRRTDALVRPARNDAHAANFARSVDLLQAFESLATIQEPTATAISVSCFPPAQQFRLATKPCANVQKLYFQTNGDIFACNYATEPRHRFGNYLAQDGLLKALQERRLRFPAFVTGNNVMAGCPALGNYEGRTPH